jgi:hypothetical protein
LHSLDTADLETAHGTPKRSTSQAHPQLPIIVSPEKNTTLDLGVFTDKLSVCQHHSSGFFNAERPEFATFFLGATGAGKTTTIMLLIGVLLRIKQVVGQFLTSGGRLINEKKSVYDCAEEGSHYDGVIGHDESKTAGIIVYKDETGNIFIDTPGLHDTGGDEVSLANALHTSRAVQHCQHARIVVLFNAKEFEAGRLGGMVAARLWSVCNMLFPEPPATKEEEDRILNSVIFLFSNAEPDHLSSLIPKVARLDKTNAPESRLYNRLVNRAVDCLEKHGDTIILSRDALFDDAGRSKEPTALKAALDSCNFCDTTSLRGCPLDANQISKLKLSSGKELDRFCHTLKQPRLSRKTIAKQFKALMGLQATGLDEFVGLSQEAAARGLAAAHEMKRIFDQACHDFQSVVAPTSSSGRNRSNGHTQSPGVSNMPPVFEQNDVELSSMTTAVALPLLNLQQLKCLEEVSGWHQWARTSAGSETPVVTCYNEALESVQAIFQELKDAISIPVTKTTVLAFRGLLVGAGSGSPLLQFLPSNFSSDLKQIEKKLIERYAALGRLTENQMMDLQQTCPKWGSTTSVVPSPCTVQAASAELASTSSLTDELFRLDNCLHELQCFEEDLGPAFPHLEITAQLRTTRSQLAEVYKWCHLAINEVKTSLDHGLLPDFGQLTPYLRMFQAMFKSSVVLHIRDGNEIDFAHQEEHREVVARLEDKLQEAYSHTVKGHFANAVSPLIMALSGLDAFGDLTSGSNACALENLTAIADEKCSSLAQEGKGAWAELLRRLECTTEGSPNVPWCDNGEPADAKTAVDDKAAGGRTSLGNAGGSSADGEAVPGVVELARRTAAIIVAICDTLHQLSDVEMLLCAFSSRIQGVSKAAEIRRQLVTQAEAQLKETKAFYLSSLSQQPPVFTVVREAVISLSMLQPLLALTTPPIELMELVERLQLAVERETQRLSSLNVESSCADFVTAWCLTEDMQRLVITWQTDGACLLVQNAPIFPGLCTILEKTATYIVKCCSNRLRTLDIVFRQTLIEADMERTKQYMDDIHELEAFDALLESRPSAMYERTCRELSDKLKEVHTQGKQAAKHPENLRRCQSILEAAQKTDIIVHLSKNDCPLQMYLEDLSSKHDESLHCGEEDVLRFISSRQFSQASARLKRMKLDPAVPKEANVLDMLESTVQDTVDELSREWKTLKKRLKRCNFAVRAEDVLRTIVDVRLLAPYVATDVESLAEKVEKHYAELSKQMQGELECHSYVEANATFEALSLIADTGCVEVDIHEAMLETHTHTLLHDIDVACGVMPTNADEASGEIGLNAGAYSLDTEFITHIVGEINEAVAKDVNFSARWAMKPFSKQLMRTLRRGLTHAIQQCREVTKLCHEEQEALNALRKSVILLLEEPALEAHLHIFSGDLEDLKQFRDQEKRLVKCNSYELLQGDPVAFERKLTQADVPLCEKQEFMAQLSCSVKSKLNELNSRFDNSDGHPSKMARCLKDTLQVAYVATRGSRLTQKYSLASLEAMAELRKMLISLIENCTRALIDMSRRMCAPQQAVDILDDIVDLLAVAASDLGLGREVRLVDQALAEAEKGQQNFQQLLRILPSFRIGDGKTMKSTLEILEDLLGYEARESHVALEASESVSQFLVALHQQVAEMGEPRSTADHQGLARAMEKISELRIWTQRQDIAARYPVVAQQVAGDATHHMRRLKGLLNKHFEIMVEALSTMYREKRYKEFNEHFAEAEACAKIHEKEAGVAEVIMDRVVAEEVKRDPEFFTPTDDDAIILERACGAVSQLREIQSTHIKRFFWDRVEQLLKRNVFNSEQRTLTLGMAIVHAENVGAEIAGYFPQFSKALTELFNSRHANTTVEDTMKVFRRLNPDMEANVVSSLETMLRTFISAYDGLVKRGICHGQELGAVVAEGRSEANKLCRGQQSAEVGIPRLLATIFATYTLHKAQEMGVTSDDAKQRGGRLTCLMRPHNAQVLAVLALLFLETEGSMWRIERWLRRGLKKGIKATNLKFRGLAQCSTGEGKSWVMASLGTVLAMLGFDVYAASYSAHLSKRDEKLFETVFDLFEMKEHVKYLTLEDVANDLLNQGVDLREAGRVFLCEGAPGLRKLMKVRRRNKKGPRPIMLLIDEVDTWLQSNFLGGSYNAICLHQSKAMMNLVRHVYERRGQGINVQTLMLSPLVRSLLDELHPDAESIVKDAIASLCTDVATFSATPYEIVNNKIGYVQNDGVSTNTIMGYETAFHYLDAVDAGKLVDTKSAAKAHLTLIVSCGSFAYSLLSEQFEGCLAITGTYNCHTEIAKNLLKKHLLSNSSASGITMPSIYGERKLKFRQKDDVILLEDAEETNLYSQALVRRIQEAKDGGRPVLVVMPDVAAIERFQTSDYYKSMLNGMSDRQKNAIFELDERASDERKGHIVSRAMDAGSLTLASRKVVRGLDFKSFDKKVEEAGGLLVIQTFFSLEKSEELQIQGRTSRQGREGAYLLLLETNQLAKDMEVDMSWIKEKKQGNLYNALDERRAELESKMYENIQTHIELCRGAHERATKFVDQLKAVAANSGEAVTNEKLKEAFLGLKD